MKCFSREVYYSTYSPSIKIDHIGPLYLQSLVLMQSIFYCCLVLQLVIWPQLYYTPQDPNWPYKFSIFVVFSFDVGYFVVALCAMSCNCWILGFCIFSPGGAIYSIIHLYVHSKKKKKSSIQMECVGLMFKMCSGAFVLNRIMESNSLLGP